MLYGYRITEVFVYDGLMLALQTWGYIRNLMAFATLGLFTPVLVLMYGFLPGYKETPLAVWVSKCFQVFRWALCWVSVACQLARQ